MDEIFCACCNRSIDAHHAWRGTTGTFYCSAFCADSEYDDHVRRFDTAAQDQADTRKAA
jgi:hypothetical protein